VEEFEVKFLLINKDEIENKLVNLGAKKIYDRIFKRTVFDYSDLRLDENGSFLRLRDEVDKVTLTYKRRIEMGNGHENDKGMEEIEIEVSDYNKTYEIFLRIGLVEKLSEEQRRIHYELNNISFDIDIWPLLPPYLEIEAKNWEDIENAINLLGLDPKEKKIFTTMQIYEQAGIDELSYKKLTFKEQIKKDVKE
jgi:adenylate cyclase class 2